MPSSWAMSGYSFSRPPSAREYSIWRAARGFVASPVGQRLGAGCVPGRDVGEGDVAERAKPSPTMPAPRLHQAGRIPTSPHGTPRWKRLHGSSGARNPARRYRRKNSMSDGIRSRNSSPRTSGSSRPRWMPDPTSGIVRVAAAPVRIAENDQCCFFRSAPALCPPGPTFAERLVRTAAQLIQSSQIDWFSICRVLLEVGAVKALQHQPFSKPPTIYSTLSRRGEVTPVSPVVGEIAHSRTHVFSPHHLTPPDGQRPKLLPLRQPAVGAQLDEPPFTVDQLQRCGARAASREAVQALSTVQDRIIGMRYVVVQVPVRHVSGVAVGASALAVVGHGALVGGRRQQVA